MPGARYNGQIDRKKIEQALKRTQGKVAPAADILGMKRRTLQDWVLNDEKLNTFRDILVEYRREGSLTEKAKPDKAEKAKKPPVTPLLLAKPDTNLKLKNRKTRKLLITCVQNNTDLHAVHKTCLNYAKHNNCEFIVIPIRYKNVTAYIEGKDYEAWWPVELKDYYLNDEYHVNDNLVILGDLKIQATALDPLNGISAIAKSKSAIVGHPQLAMKMIPTPGSELPKILISTGSCSEKNYSTSKAGHRAAFHHTFGALVVEVDGDWFNIRQLNATDDGCFYDLDKYYTPDGVTEGHRAAGLFVGDSHVEFMDPGVRAATFEDDDSIMAVCQPEHVFVQDVLDFYSANHHHRGNIYTQYAKLKSGLNSVERELQRVVETHNDLWSKPDTYYHYIDSNHHDHLTRWLKEADPKLDPENALIYHKLQIFMLENTRMTENGAMVPNPLEYYLKDKIVNPDRTFFHSRDERVNLHGIDLSQHGDRGPNGSRGTLKAFSNTGYKVVIGHGHSPGIEKGAYQVGTSSRLQLEYNSGYSSWFHTHCLIYPNGKRSLISVINGRWR